ncbi:hypothetical protein WA158_006623 [Blastocystis sp. Blastoise]
MSASEFCFIDDKYLFTFQDETQLWISREFIEEYPQLPFYDIIKHSEKYEDDSYYVDIPYYPMNKVIDSLMGDNVDIFSLDLKDSYDIYKILDEYSVKVDNDMQSDLIFHVKELFINYLEENNYTVNKYEKYLTNHDKLSIPIEMFNLKEKKEIHIDGLFTPQRKDGFLYYSLLIKMMNVTKVDITYDYSSKIPLEYICPKCIKDIFPFLEEISIIVSTHYKKKMNEYNKMSSLNMSNIYDHDDLDIAYDERKETNRLPKLYRYIIDEAIYTDDYSEIKPNKIIDEYTTNDEVTIKYDDKIDDRIFSIDKVSSEWGISQLLCLPVFLSISIIELVSFKYTNSAYDVLIVIKLLKEGFLESITTLSVGWRI